MTAEEYVTNRCIELENKVDELTKFTCEMIEKLKTVREWFDAEWFDADSNSIVFSGCSVYVKSDDCKKLCEALDIMDFYRESMEEYENETK